MLLKSDLNVQRTRLMPAKNISSFESKMLAVYGIEIVDRPRHKWGDLFSGSKTPTVLPTNFGRVYEPEVGQF